MPRKAREKGSSGIYHLMARGINKQNIFIDDFDRQKFLDFILKFNENSDCIIYGYCLMNNHIHLLFHEKEGNISDFMKKVNGSYAQYFNNKYERVGHLFQGRFKSEPVDTDQYLHTVLRYIHQNPLKAGLVDNIELYKWSSYGEYIGKPQIVDVDFILGIYNSERAKAIEYFDRFSRENNNDQCLESEEKIKLSDQELFEVLNKYNIDINQIYELCREERNKIIRRIKKINGVTIRQISRITGLSKSLIDKI